MSNRYPEKYQPQPGSRLAQARLPAEQRGAQLAALDEQLARLQSAQADAVARVKHLQGAWAAAAADDAEKAMAGAKKRQGELAAARADAEANREALIVLQRAREALLAQAIGTGPAIHNITDRLDRLQTWMRDAQAELDRKRASLEAAEERSAGADPLTAHENSWVARKQYWDAEAALAALQRRWDWLAALYLEAPAPPTPQHGGVKTGQAKEKPAKKKPA